jgi:two-component system phosphate regulon sensor histidine kinase PhoR
VIRACHNPRVRKLVVLFVLLSGVPLAVLGWLGWRLVEQDRALESQRMRERRENASLLVAHELDRRLADWERSADVPPGASFLAFNNQGVVRRSGAPIAFFPDIARPPELSLEIFAGAEAEEFREGSCYKAAVSYRQIARDKNPLIRAAALMRLARCSRKLDQIPEALTVYADLAALSETPVAGAPSGLVARRERIALFKVLHDDAGREREEAALISDLAEGRFAVDHATFDFYSEALEHPLGPVPSVELAKAVEALWPALRHQPAGRSTHDAKTGAVLAVWRQTSSGTAVLLGNVEVLAKAMIPASEFDEAAAHAAWTSRRNLLMAGFALMIFVIAAASYAAFRAVSRELGVARLQSDFVAAVSHEFRTPLTAMRHLTEMLEEGNVGAERAADYYGALGRETRRLHEMVESLLDFGRMESGRHVYHMEETSAADLTQRVVGEFRERAAATTHRIELNATPEQDSSRGKWQVRADCEALSLALRTLLDNAIKYSPESSTVQVALEYCNGLAGISVHDQGPGIPKDEQRAVFRKFVRGAAARALNVKGTGIGLTMADQIVRAHGGRLELASEPGRGTRFTILLPLLNGD